MGAQQLKNGLGVLGALIATWLVASLICYLLLYRTIGQVYIKIGREILQTTCGRIVDNELIYTLEPGECRFRNIEFDTIVAVDSDGFRNRASDLGTGATKVTVLGDSYAMGWGIDQDKKLSSLIAGTPGYRVRDLAMSSYGTARELLALLRHDDEAGIVVLQYCSNDIWENIEFIRDPDAFVRDAPARAKEYAQSLAEYRGRSGSRRGLQRVVNALLWGVTVPWRLMRLPPRSGPVTPRRVLEGEARAFAAVMAHFSPRLSGRPVIVFDAYERSARPEFAAVFRSALDAAGVDGVVVVDLAGTIVPSDYFHIDDHLSPTGHRKLAQRLMAEIEGLKSRPNEAPQRSQAIGK